MISLPIGISDFATVVKDQYDFVDKSLFIKEVLEEKLQVLLLPRPRRFGKTLNMSMLYYFFSLHEKKGHLFSGLKIEQYPEIMEHQGKYPVIFISFKDVKNDSFTDAHNKIAALFSDLYKKFPELATSNKLDKDEHLFYSNISSKKANNSEIGDALVKLCEFLHRHHGTKPIMLIDEYDTPIHTSYSKNYYDQMISLMQVMLGAALKDNNNLQKGILTGILKVAKESIFSGLNNIIVCSLLSKHHNWSFGFSEAEVLELLIKAKLEHKLKEVQAWYNGYDFSSVQIYNPWSILNYIFNGGIAIPYWVNTSNNELIRDLMLKSTSVEFKNAFEDLIQGKLIEQRITENIVFRDLAIQGNKDTIIWSLLLFSGYLTMKNVDLSSGYAKGQVLIPNREIATVYNNIFADWLDINLGSGYENIANNLVSGKFDIFADQIHDYLLKVGSHHDFTRESDYHCFILGLLVVLSDSYIVKSNREFGRGRADLIIVSKHSNDGMIIEFKHAKEEQDLREVAKEGLAQITAKRYDLMLTDYPNVKELTLACLAFSRREVFYMKEVHKV